MRVSSLAHIPAPDGAPPTDWSTIDVFAVDAVPLATEGLAYLARRTPQLRLVGAVATVAQARVQLPALTGTVITIGDTTPGVADLLAELRASRPEAGLVVVSHRPGRERSLWARRAGASAFVGSDTTATTLVAAIRYAGRPPAPFRSFGADVGRVATRPRTVEFETLSDREQQVLRLVRDGRSHAEIGVALGIRLGTVRTYVNRIYAKLNVRNRAQALVAAFGGNPELGGPELGGPELGGSELRAEFPVPVPRGVAVSRAR
ncbi:response regulator transcription factor [Natronosporangium hydrolyticum]|uniref:Response regulator transcription factor n=1 Tax=Natronosporangium hydrolyticum TaxID=2811111 RepID=A0A895YBL7_9ACTN|nr:response regulator transcription factor [Natronosporangium hydrolyticum]QSB15204.1 response regulator transcription factor [Natronosporangium hydrolyticum]